MQFPIVNKLLGLPEKSVGLKLEFDKFSTTYDENFILKGTLNVNS